MQITLGHAHLARVRALDALPGFRCIGVQLAESQRHRVSEPSSEMPGRVVTLSKGKYGIGRAASIVSGARRLFHQTPGSVVVVDSISDPIQLAVAQLARTKRHPVAVRWATTF